MRPSHTEREKHVQLNIDDLSEDEVPEPGLPQAVFGTEEFVKVRKWKINKVFCFLGATAVTCMSAVVAAPHLAVFGAVVAIWTGSVFLARFLLAGAYRNTGKRPKKAVKHPAEEQAAANN